MCLCTSVFWDQNEQQSVVRQKIRFSENRCIIIIMGSFLVWDKNWRFWSKIKCIKIIMGHFIGLIFSLAGLVEDSNGQECLDICLLTSVHSKVDRSVYSGTMTTVFSSWIFGFNMSLTVFSLRWWWAAVLMGYFTQKWKFCHHLLNSHIVSNLYDCLIKEDNCVLDPIDFTWTISLSI